MEKKVIAVLFGGNSSEYEVSLQSASSVLENMDREKYEIVPIGITRQGEWIHYKGEIDKIKDNTWSDEKVVEIFYVGAEITDIAMQDNCTYQISGNNMDGFVVTLWRCSNE